MCTQIPALGSSRRICILTTVHFDGLQTSVQRRPVDDHLIQSVSTGLHEYYHYCAILVSFVDHLYFTSVHLLVEIPADCDWMLLCGETSLLFLQCLDVKRLLAIAHIVCLVLVQDRGFHTGRQYLPRGTKPGVPATTSNTRTSHLCYL